MIRKLFLHICILATLLPLLLGTSLAQSLGDVARNSKASKKPARVITNDNLPEAGGPANGAAFRPDGEPLPAEAAKDAGNDKTPAGEHAAARVPEGQQEKQLREEIRTVNAQIDEYGKKMEAEPNEATRAAMQNMIDGYDKLRQSSQQQLDELVAARNKDKAAK
jgi:hypothetical protein